MPSLAFHCKIKAMKLDRFIKKMDLIELTRRLIRIPRENPPGNEKRAALFLKPFLSKMGFQVNVLLSPKGRYNLVAEKPLLKDNPKWTRG